MDQYFLNKRDMANMGKVLIFKFRSMKVIESGNSPYLKQATREDDRTTPLGSFLRKWSLDELPQLFNVLRGDMSLVGPRPHAVSHNESYRKIISGYMQRHTLKPGMTGLAQIEGFRGETRTKKDMEKRIDADLRYKKRLEFDFRHHNPSKNNF